MTLQRGPKEFREWHMSVVRSRTRVTTFRKIADAGETGRLLVRLMMAVNDLGIANHGLGQWKESPPSGHEGRSQGARSYFLRLMMAHTYEALKVIHKISSTPKFKKLVDQCDRPTREAFERLVKVVGTLDYKTMKRDAVTFHYETDAIAKAIERQSERFPDHPLSLSIGREMLDWYFERADRAVDSIIVREAIGLKTYPVVSNEVDEVATRLQKIAEDLANFSGYFIPRYVLGSKH